jgi:hypothetical protein
MGCEFDPEIAARELGEEGIAQIRNSEMAACPTEKMQPKPCCGHCVCVCSNKVERVREVEPPAKQGKSDDPRIAHSLDTNQREASEFSADKYQQAESELKSKPKAEGAGVIGSQNS